MFYHPAMKAERLLAILTILLNRKKISAPALARELEVSLRTVYRDIDALAEAGIPVYATAGRCGGFELMEGFTISEQLLASGEIRQILAGLEGLSGIYSGPAFAGMIEKFRLLLKQSEKGGVKPAEKHLFIELTPSRREKATLDEIEVSITEKTALSIRYIDARGMETERTIEPHALVFVWQSWYVYAWCRMREDFRMFKLSRVIGAEKLNEGRQAPAIDLSTRPWDREWESIPFEEIELVADASMRARLGEFFDADGITDAEDGRIRIRARLPVDEWVLSFIMGLQGSFEIIKPGALRSTIAERARTILGNNAS
jgi:predicted DNA-binding transcriptional regulator YafY